MFPQPGMLFIPSAFTVESIRNNRWLLGSGGRGTSAFWRSVETVNGGKQLLFMQRVLFTFQIRRKQVRHISTARLATEAWEMLLETSCLMFHVLEEMATAKDEAGNFVFSPQAVEKARQRGVEGRPD